MAESSVVSRRTGSLRGVEGGVERILNALRQNKERTTISPALRRLRDEERGEHGKRGKVVLYMTSIKAIRKTHERCKQILLLLQAHQVALTVKDVFLHPDYGKELHERMSGFKDISLPQLFVAGSHIGGGQDITEMNERGELGKLLQDYKKSESCAEVCELCGGQLFVACLWCNGSKKGIKNTFNDLKCTVCNQNGLQKCPECFSNS